VSKFDEEGSSEDVESNEGDESSNKNELPIGNASVSLKVYDVYTESEE